MQSPMSPLPCFPQWCRHTENQHNIQTRKLTLVKYCFVHTDFIQFPSLFYMHLYVFARLYIVLCSIIHLQIHGAIITVKIQNYSITTQELPRVFTFFHPCTLAVTNLSPSLQLFHECCINRIMQYRTFWDCLISSRMLHVSMHGETRVYIPSIRPLKNI